MAVVKRRVGKPVGRVRGGHGATLLGCAQTRAHQRTSRVEAPVTDLRLTSAAPDGVRADGAVLVAIDGDDGLEIRHDGALRAETVHALTTTATQVMAGDPYATTALVPTTGRLRCPVACVSVAKSGGVEDVRRAVGAGVRALGHRTTVLVVAPGRASDVVAATVTGALLGGYSFERYRTHEPERTAQSLVVSAASARKTGVREAAEDAQIVATATCLARDWVNTSPADLGPQDLADAVRRAAADTSLRVDVWDEGKLERSRCGGILGVGQGSARPPRLVRIRYRPPKGRRHVGLVGKGVTFDSGGLSLKTLQGMVTMKADMGGAAAVAAATIAAAQLRLPVKITAYLALAENMPSGSALRPGDVITTHNGTTVEVLNTDAEGRLLLADALSLACEDKPDALIDIATLTGAQTIALGPFVGGAMSNSDTLRSQVVESGEAAGESLWPMPLPAELRSSLDSKIADIANVGERLGSMLTAGLFLENFVTTGQPWVHLDIAGPAFNEKPPTGYLPTGGTGFGVGTLVNVARSFAS